MSEIKGLWWGEAILLGGHVQNLDWFVGSFSDKGALHVPKGGGGGVILTNFMKVVQSSINEHPSGIEHNSR